MQNGLRIAGLVELASRDAGRSEAPFVFLHRLLQRVYPNLRWTAEHRWMGHRPATVDSVPVVGVSPDCPRVLFAFGTHRVGMASGPRIGRLIAGLVAEHKTNLIFHPFAWTASTHKGIADFSTGVWG